MREAPSDRDREAIHRAVDIAYDYVPRSMRSLRDVYRCAFPAGSVARSELARWTGNDPLGRIFNADSDSSEISDRLVAYDCRHAFDREELASPLIRYLIHRIWSRSRSKATPTVGGCAKLRRFARAHRRSGGVGTDLPASARTPQHKRAQARSNEGDGHTANGAQTGTESAPEAQTPKSAAGQGQAVLRPA